MVVVVLVVKKGLYEHQAHNLDFIMGARESFGKISSRERDMNRFEL